MFDSKEGSVGATSASHGSTTPSNGYASISKVENGFIVGNLGAQRVYTDFDAMVADLKTYFNILI